MARTFLPFFLFSAHRTGIPGKKTPEPIGKITPEIVSDRPIE